MLLMKMATRIKARAFRRAGELLKQIQPATGAHRKSEGGHTLSRMDAATDAGMSKHQQMQAVRVASVPAADFERLVESRNPPTLTQLAQMGIKPRPVLDLKGRDPRDFNRAAAQSTATITFHAPGLQIGRVHATRVLYPPVHNSCAKFESECHVPSAMTVSAFLIASRRPSASSISACSIPCITPFTPEPI